MLKQQQLDVDVLYMHGRANVLFQTMVSMPWILWMFYFCGLLESFSFYSFAFIFVMFLSEVHHFDDVNAGKTYAMFAFMSIFFSAASEAVMHQVGYLYKTSLVGLLIVGVARFMLTFTDDFAALSAIVFFLLPLGSAFNVSQVEAAIFKCTTEKNRPFAISMLEVADNIGGLIAALSVDFVRYFGRTGIVVTLIGRKGLYQRHLTTYEITLFVSALASLVVFFIHMCIIGDLKSAGKTKAKQSDEEFEETPIQFTKRTSTDKRFWLVMVMTILLTGTRMTYRHIETTLPKYMFRYFGAESPWGSVMGVPRLSNLLFGPLLRHRTASRSSYTCLLMGSCTVAVASIVFIFLQNYYTVFIFVLVVGMAEEIWGPRLMELITALSGSQVRGHEYNRISIILSSSLSAILAGFQSGMVLQDYCPEFGKKHPGTLWMFALLGGLVSPVGLYMLRPGMLYFLATDHPSQTPADDYQVVRRYISSPTPHSVTQRSGRSARSRASRDEETASLLARHRSPRFMS